MTRDRLLIISYSPLRRDARVLRQIRLFAEDYEVTTVGYGPAPDGVADHVQIPDEIIYWHKDRRLLAVRAYQRMYDRMPVTRFLRERLETGGHDIILANDVDTVPLAVTLSTPSCTSTPPGSWRNAARGGWWWRRSSGGWCAGGSPGRTR